MNKHLRALLIVGGLAVLIVVATMLYMNRASGPQNSQGLQQRPIQINQELPGFEAQTLKGQSIKLSDFKGKVVIVNFWASWCGPCVEEVPSLISLLKTFPNDVALIAISGDSNQEDINSFLKSFPEMNSLPNSYVVWDSEKKLIPQYQVFRLPESFVVGKDLKLVKKISGTIDWHTEDAIAYLKQLASGEAGESAEPTSGTSTE
ncbi:TlpA family protein disulfide reductase [Bdellovibrio sp. HCB337]|uniref:TlpA family protein disulfide reductase n=1 Tax=Bdellovibrio sp. HCB337 TaxID=3394358 RepID=UPI0039A728DB